MTGTAAARNSCRCGVGDEELAPVVAVRGVLIAAPDDVSLAIASNFTADNLLLGNFVTALLRRCYAPQHDTRKEQLVWSQRHGKPPKDRFCIRSGPQSVLI